MIQVWKRKGEPTPGLSKRTSLTGNARLFPYSKAEYIYLFLSSELVSAFLNKLEEVFLNLS